MTGIFWAPGLPWRVALAQSPDTLDAMYHAALWRRRVVFGDNHPRWLQAFYYGR
jgi:hypothetical protein